RRRAARLADDTPGIGNLAAGLEVKRRARQGGVAHLARGQRIDRLPAFVEQRHDRDAGLADARVALELIADAGQLRLVHGEVVALFRAAERAARARLVALSFHRALESLAID